MNKLPPTAEGRTSCKSPERGNVMFYILIAVTLLAALIFAVSQSGRGSMGQVNEEKIRLLASEIIEYANNVSTAYSQLRLRGCKLEEMSFENTDIAGYANGGAPTDQTCNIFALAGGGITFSMPPGPALDDAGTALELFTIEMEIDEAGSTCGDANCSDMIMVSGPLLEAVCVQINSVLSATTTTPGDMVGFASDLDKYTGTASYALTIGDDVGSSALRGKTAICMKDTDNNLYYFYKVLQAR